ncbi:SLATT domain-containing protein [Chryseobacterium turcicum]|uniref:SLATT domain-containing protein n=1 Tax=Chryseobacterium turcicum TaxID=2898076 RepID=A0A9Q3V3K3_9FLAO|nr:SLATT domain-containing protein [Chryseobacterium turcicum]MCD1117712.1 SLATT domain-containing protein [Chryseobacterium turcicum]
MKDDSINDSFYLQIQKEINRIERKARSYTWMFYFIRIIQIAFAGTITVLSGMMKIKDLDATTNILILGAVTTAVTAIDTLFQVDNKKNTYKLVLFELRSIRAELVYNFIKSEEIPEAIKHILFEKYKSVNSYARELISIDFDNNTNNTEIKR